MQTACFPQIIRPKSCSDLSGAAIFLVIRHDLGALNQQLQRFSSDGFILLYSCNHAVAKPPYYIQHLIRDGSKSFFASPSQVTSHFRASPSQVTSHLVRRQVKSSHKSFGPNTSQVTSLFVQVQVKSHIISSTPVIRRGI